MEKVLQKNWLSKAFRFLALTLEEPPHEINELDWKVALSPDKHKLTEHLSAFSNFPGGGFMVYGIDRTGKPVGILAKEIDPIINTLANIGRKALNPPLKVDHAVEAYGGVRLLFVFIQESTFKPVHLKGKDLSNAFIRCGGTTRPASLQEIGTMLLHSSTPRWEGLRASLLLTDSELLSKLNLDPIFKMTETPAPTTLDDRLDWAAEEKFVEREPSGGGYVTNLGAIATARNIGEFPDISRKAVRVIVYSGPNKSKTKLEQEGKKGYAVSFQGLLDFVASHLPQSEVIEQALRRKLTVYPVIALREIIANALIHQDFSITGTGPMVEIFSNRIEISNPGGILPSKRLDRLIGTQPESRNELLARAFRRYKICEERGSGLLKAGGAIELYGLPPIQFESGSNFFKVTLHAPRTFAEMADSERLQTCYQHAVLKFYSDDRMTNTSLRKRLKMPDKQRSMVSALISEGVAKKMIKQADPENSSKKFTEYVPIWA